LLVAISVDQFSADLFAEFRQHFTAGFATLEKGAVFPQGYQSHAATETCPGHSTLLTGVHPARTGIIANNWYEPGLPRAEKKVYCVEDEHNPASSPEKPVVTSAHLKAPTLGDLMKRVDPKSLNVAVSAKDRAAVMMSGHDVDAAYWWDGTKWTTYADRKILPAAMAETVATNKVIAAGAPPLPLPGWCAPKDRPVAVGDFTVGTFRFGLKPGDEKGYLYSPRVDAATGDLAIRLVDALGLGKHQAPDILSVSFSATDYVGHAYGTEGAEMCIQLTQLDQTIGTLLHALDQRGIDYAVVLTADHGGIDLPERLHQQGFPGAQRVSAELSSKALSTQISARTGITAPSGPLLYGAGHSGNIWLAAGLTGDQRKTVIAALVERLKSDPQIAGVFTAGQLEAMPVPRGDPQDWTLAQRVRASFTPGVSGEVVMMDKRGVIPVARPGRTDVTGHGDPWDYDRRVPMLFWRKGYTGFEQPDPVETVDIAPTFAALIGLREPAGTWDGRCLDIDGGKADTCAP